MWTPKRILLLFGGLTLFLIGFGVYAYFLGGIDGLQPLPQEYILSAEIVELPPPLDDLEPEADRKLRLAFGNECPEINRTVKVDVKKKGLTFASEQFILQPDGRVCFKPCSLALFGKEHAKTGFPEINTVRSEAAYLTFDRPISSLADIGNRKIVGAELNGAITIINNRSTPQMHDDVEVYIINGPLTYNEPQNLISTRSFVKLLDKQAQPDPTQVTAIGLEIHLTPDTNLSGSARPAAKPRSSNVSGIDKVILLSNVDMRLHIDPKSKFMAGTRAGKSEAPLPAVAKEEQHPEDSHITIRTLGRFTYDSPKNLAIFESPPPRPQSEKPQAFPSDQVEVIRIHKQDKSDQKTDQLSCDRLELQFRSKTDDAGRPSRARAEMSDLEIDTATATARPGREVVISLDSENLNAQGVELIYRSPTDTSGAQTILRGQPMWAVKDAHQIRARELHLVADNSKGEGQHAIAKGPGQIDLIDHNSPSKPKEHQYHAVWRDRLIVTRDKEGDRFLDRLTFLGEAAFIDDLHKQRLQGDKLDVWVEPAEREGLNDPGRAGKQRAAEAPRQQPQKLEALGKVKVNSPDLIVHDCQHLVVRFKANLTGSLPDALPAAAAPGPAATLETAHVAQKANMTLNLPPIQVQAPQASPAAAPPPDNKVTVHLSTAGDSDGDTAERETFGWSNKKSLQKPINLTARYVAVDVLRTLKKYELLEVITRGDVHVWQEPSTAKNKGVDIHGETLNLLHHLEGDTLIVFGGERGPAQLQLGEMMLIGPKVLIDQRDNVAEVKGIGAMHLPSDQGFDGSKTTGPDKEMTIHWTKDMFFNGQTALFQGGVQAYQNDASLRCQVLQVSLDKSVSFREGQQGGQGAKVTSLVCHGQVDIADIKKDAQDKLLRYERMIARQLNVDNQQGPANATGPGRVYMLQQGSVNDMSMDAKKKHAATRKDEEKRLHLTRVDFGGRLYSTRKDKVRIAKFYDDVKVFHLPADDLNVKLNPDKLPHGGMYLECDLLTVCSWPSADGKTHQYLQADKNVRFRSEKFYGFAEKVKYDQQTDQIVFEGSGTNMVTLYEYQGPGQQPKTTRTRLITYNRRTGNFSTDGLQMIQTKER